MMKNDIMKSALVGYADNEIIYDKDHLAESLYFIVKGKVGKMQVHSKGAIVVEELGPGQFIGASSYFTKTNRPFRMLALKGVKALKITDDNLHNFIESSPAAVKTLLIELSKNLRSVDDKFVRMNAKTIDYSYNQKVDLPNLLKGRAFPIGHYSYPQMIPSDHVAYLLNKSVYCPICDEEFNTFPIRNSRLKVTGTDPDFRSRYEDFDTIWYDIWTCPHCNYSNLHYDFFNVNANEKSEVRDILLVASGSFTEKHGIKESYNQIFDGYYLALACLEGIKSNSFNRGKIWLNLAWLYKDIGQGELYKMAYDQACILYSDGWFSCTTRLSESDEQKLCLMLGEMYLSKGDFTNSKNYFLKGINNKSGKQMLNDRARNRIQDVKDIEKGIV